MDWTDLTREDQLVFTQVSPTNLDDTVAPLEDVDLSGSSITYGYYTDTRVSGTLVTYGDYKLGSFIRIGHRVPSEGYERELGTFIVTANPSVRSNGRWRTTLKLQSILYGLSTDIADLPWCISQNATAMKAIRDILEYRNRQYVDGGAIDSVFNSPILLESGKSRLSHIYALCSASGNRLDVDGHGRVVISEYVNPATVTPQFTFDLDDPKGIMLDELSRESNYLSEADTVIVNYRYTDKDDSEKEIAATVTSDYFGARGYTIADFHSISDMSPATQLRAAEIAESYLPTGETLRFEIAHKHLPIKAGDVVYLKVRDGEGRYVGRHKCLVQTTKLSLKYMDMRTTLKSLGVA